jgi:hypothetical protein
MSDLDTITSLSHNARAALALAQHMHDMGAHQTKISVEVNNIPYTITISKSARKRKLRTVANPPVEVSSGTLGTHKQQETNINITKN